MALKRNIKKEELKLGAGTKTQEDYPAAENHDKERLEDYSTSVP